ncbi:hypothetical protein NDU88_006046 [Pleurodeles waltl]|uniref:Uncharacterized protein n=1 Tax=Pleurodeles waltl TaxID=8319 RepID=A0AAV7WF35_PLEWA|nr:hypothetical protein NDU88_006046 [Pleurodeles waltl]
MASMTGTSDSGTFTFRVTWDTRGPERFGSPTGSADCWRGSYRLQPSRGIPSPRVRHMDCDCFGGKSTVRSDKVPARL